MLAAASAHDGLHVMLPTDRADAQTLVEFCGRLVHDDGGPAFLIVNRHPVPTATEGRLRLGYLPTSSPELTPDEGVWKNVTHDHVGCSGITSRGDLCE